MNLLARNHRLILFIGLFNRTDNWGYSNAGQSSLAADLDNSLRVDVNDLSILADFWQFDYEDAYNVWWWDYDYSGRVDIGDLGYLVDYWPDYFDLIDFAMFAKYWQREVDERFGINALILSEMGLSILKTSRYWLTNGRRRAMPSRI